MKPSNLFIQGAKSGGKRKMRIRYNAHRVFGVGFFLLGAAPKKFFASGAADLIPQLGITETSKYTKYSLGFCNLICEIISRCPSDKSFLKLALC